MTKKRTKKKVISNVTLEQAQAASELFAVNNNQLAKVEAKINEEINKVKSKYQERVTELKDSLEEPVETLQVFATEQKEAWGKKKSMELLHCIIGFRTGNPKVVALKKFTWAAVLELVKKNDILKRFARPSWTIDKEGILALEDEKELQELKENCYIGIDQDETFFVKAKEEDLVEA